MESELIIKDSFVYDEFSDRLLISNLKNKDQVIGSVSVLNLTIDFTKESRIANIEIKHVSDYLKSIDIDSSILKNLDEAKISLKQLRNGYVIYFLLKHGGMIERIPYNVQTQNAISLV